MTSVSSHAPVRRRGIGARRSGYVVSAGVDAVLLVLVNAWPGWDAVPFLTDETPRVLGLVDATLAVGLLANVVYLLRDAIWVRAVGDVVTTSLGLAALVRLWQVFPLDVSDGWRLIAHVLVGLGVLGSAISILTALVRLTR